MKHVQVLFFSISLLSILFSIHTKTLNEEKKILYILNIYKNKTKLINIERK